MVSTAKNVAAGLGVLLLICMNGCGVSSQRRGRLGAGINIAKEFDCPEEFGYYPHPHDCTMYYVCVFGGALLESCTGGLMYSQELQTCDWPRNVGCTVSEVETATTPTTRVTEPRSRHTTATQARNNPAISAREQSQRQQQDEIAKHQLYADDVGPAEEVETDRQQRVYRGQPATITLGQNLDTRHQVTNAIPSPSGRIASGDKIGVISFGTQHNQQQQQHQQPQQHSQYRVEPTSAPSAYVQELLAPTKASPLYNGSQQYDLTQYDPYYSLYDEDVELYRDVDYGQFPSNQGNQQSNGNQYRGNQNSFKQAEERPAVQQQQPQQPERNSAAGYAQQQPAYIAQDAYAQTVSAPAQQDFNQNSYGQSQQTGDQGQYQPRTPIKAPPTRQQTRLRPETADGVSLSSRQTQTANLVPVPYPLPVPSAVTTHYPLPVPTAVPTPVPISRDITQTKHVVRRVLLKAAVVLRDPLKSLESQPDNRSSSKRIAFANRDENNAQPKSRQGSSKIITLSTSGGNSRVDNEPKTYTGSSFIVSNPEPHVREQTNPDPIQSSRNTDSRFIVDSLYVDLSGPSPTQLVFIESSSTTSTTSQPETVSKYLLRRSSTVPSTTVKAQAERKNLASRKAFFRATIENVKDYNSDAVVASRIPAQDDIASPVIIRSRSQIRKTTQTTVPELEDVPSSEDPPRVPVQDDIGGVTSPAIIRSRPQIRKQIKTAISELEGNSFSVDSPHVPVQDDTGDTSSPAIVRARPQIRKPIKTTIPELEQTSFSEDPISFNSLSPDNSQLPTEATSPARTRIASGRIALSQNTPKCSEGKANSCNEIPQIRIRPTTASPDYQATPGPVRGSVRNRGNQAYNSASGETPNRGTPAPITRSRPTLKPSTAIVSKAQEFIDIYRFGEASRPEPVYATPQVDKTAAKCRKDVCLLPDCSCGGKEIPGDLPAETVPQIVLLTFDDSVNDLNKGLYSSLFEKGRVNPNGCPIAATFYVSHEWTNYGQVQSLYADGHEIASHSVSHSFGEQFSQKKWTREIAGQREILAAYGGVRVEDVRGMRAPFLSVGGNKMFKMLYDSNFTYDSSMPVYENKPPSYPYTFDYKIFHDCMIPPCPTRSYPGVWEVPMVMWQDLNGGRCSMGDACSNPPTADGVYKMLIKNFERHYTTNRAPFGLFYHAAWFTQVHHKEGFEAFLDTIVNMPDVWLVTNWQALQWVRDPTPISRINSFQPFQCNYPERPKRCNSPKVCNLWHKTGVRYMKTCQPCPDIYPWTGKSGVRNSRVDNEIIDE